LGYCGAGSIYVVSCVRSGYRKPNERDSVRSRLLFRSGYGQSRGLDDTCGGDVCHGLNCRGRLYLSLGIHSEVRVIERDVSFDRYPVSMADFRIVIPDCQMLGAPVVPKCDRVGLPVKAAVKCWLGTMLE